jgi:hypothetical protein
VCILDLLEQVYRDVSTVETLAITRNATCAPVTSVVLIIVGQAPSDCPCAVLVDLKTDVTSIFIGLYL